MNSENDVLVIDLARTAIGSFLGGASGFTATEMGSAVIKALLSRTRLSASEVDELIIGQVLTAGCGQNPARQTSVAAGIPVTASALTINKVCGSGVKSIQLAFQAIKNGDADVVIAGGQESMSQAPHVTSSIRCGVKMGGTALIDSMIKDGLWDAFHDYHMGNTAENVARKWGITREEQDHFAYLSQQKTTRAKETHQFSGEIIPLTSLNKRNETVIFDQDEFHRPGTTQEKLSLLKPAFDKAGTVTAGNASGINDGAAMVILMSRKKATELGLEPLAIIHAIASAGVEPALMGTGPIPASIKALKRTGWQTSDLELIESNEAFAAQAIAVNREMGWDVDKVNVNGGAIALGHPIGASGTRIFVSLVHELKRRGLKKGLATLCIGGGMGIAATVEML